VEKPERGGSYLVGDKVQQVKISAGKGRKMHDEEGKEQGSKILKASKVLRDETR